MMNLISVNTLPISLKFAFTGWVRCMTVVIAANFISSLALGAESSGYTFVLVSGLGEGTASWTELARLLEKKGKVISYNRNGLGGRSYSGSHTKNLTAMILELDSVLQKAQSDSKVILIGHSMGCQLVMAYVTTARRKIDAVVLLDPGFSEARLRSAISDSLWMERERTLSRYRQQMSPAQRDEFSALQAITDEVEAISKFPGIPMYLITCVKINEQFPASGEELGIKIDEHRRIIHLWPDSRHFVACQSRHYIHADDPEYVKSKVDSLLVRLSP